MTNLRFEATTIPAASLGGTNPLPELREVIDTHAQIKRDASVSDEEAKYMGRGMVFNCMPYLTQDQYDRDKKERPIQTAVLENDYLKATFIPEWGGRLWSLYDKTAGRELLYKNPVFQPANLALRNAWFAGGIEWNVGIIGHSPLTLSPLHTASLTLDDGTPVLRMYEWERIRRVSYSMDFILPKDSKFLYVRVQVRNTTPKETFMYWWSNIAVPEADDIRVIAPAEKAFRYDYKNGMSKKAMPIIDGTDCSYSTRIPRAIDFFFDLPDGQRRWETALDGGGYGLVQTSTDLLRGRKLFLWGNGTGGKRWQEFLAQPGCRYIEIQAGLARTQTEHIPMPANASWEWMEAYGALQADPKAVHGDWACARNEVETLLEANLPRHNVDEAFVKYGKVLDKGLNIEVKSFGSGWGTLERKRLEKNGELFNVGGVTYDDAALTDEEAPWLTLLNENELPGLCPSTAPKSYMVQPEWIKMLEDSIAAGKSDNWHAWLQLGVMRANTFDYDAAYTAFENSLKLEPTAWAYRALAILEERSKNWDAAVELIMKAMELQPITPIAIECGRIMMQVKKYQELIDQINCWPEAVRSNGRVKTGLIHAYININKFEAAQQLLGTSSFEVYDIREGEILLSDLWLELHKRRLIAEEGAEDTDELTERVKREYPIPERLDFRMH